jgi:hypothetical protein
VPGILLHTTRASGAAGRIFAASGTIFFGLFYSGLHFIPATLLAFRLPEKEHA